MTDRTQRYRGKDYGKYTFVVPNPNDILCGKDRSTFSHLGNRRFRYIISMNASSYVETKTKRERSFMVGAIVSMIHEKGARFVKKDSQTAMYYEICTEHARDKVAHALRDTCARVSKFKNDDKPPTSKDTLKQLSKDKSNGLTQEGMDRRLEQVYRTVEEASRIDTLPLRTAVPDSERIASESKPGEIKSKGWNAENETQIGTSFQFQMSTVPMITPTRSTPPTTEHTDCAPTHPLVQPPVNSSNPFNLETRMNKAHTEVESSNFRPAQNRGRAFGRYPPTWDHAIGHGTFHGVSQALPVHLPQMSSMGAFIPPMDLNPSPFVDMYTPLPLNPLPLEVPQVGAGAYLEGTLESSLVPPPDVVPANETDLEPWPAHLGNDHPQTLLHSVDVLENLIAE